MRKMKAREVVGKKYKNMHRYQEANVCTPLPPRVMMKCEITFSIWLEKNFSLLHVLALGGQVYAKNGFRDVSELGLEIMSK